MQICSWIALSSDKTFLIIRKNVSLISVSTRALYKWFNVCLCCHNPINFSGIS